VAKDNGGMGSLIWFAGQKVEKPRMVEKCQLTDIGTGKITWAREKAAGAGKNLLKGRVKMGSVTMMC